MTADQELAEIGERFPGWELWHGGNGIAVPHSWHATQSTPDGCTVIAADSPAQLLRRLEQATAAVRP